MLQCIYELTTVRPYEGKTVKRTAAEFAVWRDGYYAGVDQALIVTQLARERRESDRRRQRDARKRQRSA